VGTSFYTSFELVNRFNANANLLSLNLYSKERYILELRHFARIPCTNNEQLFNKLAQKGQRLIDLHLLKLDFNNNIASFPVTSPDYSVTKVNYENQKVWINKTTFFDNIPLDVWNYYIGG